MTNKFNDAVVYGDIAQLSDLFEEEVTIAMGKNEQDRKWKNTTSKFGFLAATLCKHQVGSKSGRSFIQGSMAKDGSQRIAKGVKQLEFLVLDLDSGQPIKPVIERIQDAGLFAILYSTHSHMKRVSEFPKDMLIKKFSLEADEEITRTDVINYMSRFMGYDESIAASVDHFSIEHGDNGIVIRVSHAPMPKFRAAFLLTEPFVFANEGRTHDEAIRKWKRKYAGVAAELGADYDISCTDPSRLFYLPRHAKDAPYEVHLIVGDTLDLSEFEERDPYDRKRMTAESNAFVSAAGDIDIEIKHRWVRGWWFKNKDKFRAADFAEGHFDVRNRMSSTKISVICPNDDMHSNAGDPNDQGFFCENADGGDSGARLFCSHNSCQSHLGKGALLSYPYLDMMVDELNLTEDDLDEYLDEYDDVSTGPDLKGVIAEKKDENPPISEDEYEALSVRARFEYDISRLKTGDEKGSKKLLKRLVEAVNEREPSKTLDESFIVPLTEALSKQVWGGRKNIALDQFKKMRRSAAIEDEEETKIAVDINAGVDVQLGAVFKALRKMDEPRLFTHSDRRTWVVVDGMGDNYAQKILSEADLRTEFFGIMKFYQAANNGNLKTVRMPKEISEHLTHGVVDGCVPTLRYVVPHPMYTRKGVLNYKKGFNPDSGAFITRTTKIKSYGKVTQDDLDWAWDFLFAAPHSSDFEDIECGLFGQFPFHDQHDESGKASKLTWLACMLQPLVREIIDNYGKGAQGSNVAPTPLYLIQKPKAGSGSTLLANTMNIAIYGNNIATYQYNGGRQAEEFRKLLTAKLLSNPDGVMYYDNVNSRVDDGTFASALTSGTYSDRILGGSTQKAFHIRHLWLMSGNNVQFSDEMIRRIAPITLNAMVANPEERKGFVINDLAHYAEKNRQKILEALCIFVDNWVQKGMNEGSNRMASFEVWSRVMSGIFEAAGHTEFLQNQREFREILNQDVSADVELFSYLATTFEDAEPFASAQLLADVSEDTNTLDGTSVDFNARRKIDAKTINRYLMSRLDVTINITTKGGIKKATLKRVIGRKALGGAMYQILLDDVDGEG